MPKANAEALLEGPVENDGATRATRFPTRLFLFAYLGWAFDFFDLVLLGFIKDDIGRDLHLSQNAESWLVGVALGTSGVGGIVAGWFADRFGKRDVLAATVLLYSIGSLAAGLAPSALTFLIARSVVGLGVGGEWAIGHGMLAEAVAPNQRGRAAAALQTGGPVGFVFAAIAGYLLAPRFGWRAVMIASSATALLAFVMRRSTHLPNEGRSHAPSFKMLARSGVGKNLFLSWMLCVFKLGTYWSCYTWLPSFLVNEMHQSVGRSLTWVVTAQVGQVLGMMTFGIIADRVGRRLAFTMYSLLTALAIAPIAFAWETLSDNPALFWMAMFALGVGSGCVAGFGALLAELFPTEVRGAAMGTAYNVARTAQLGVPSLVGYAVLMHGIAGGLTVPIVLALATASWVWLLPETRGIVLPTLEGDPPAVEP